MTEPGKTDSADDAGVGGSESQEAEEVAALPSRQARAVSGVSWTLVGYVTQSVLRFGSNLVLTRLLDPSAFGLMSLTLIFVLGLELLSDIGVGPAIIQSKRGEDKNLLDTAWTIQIIRGFGLFVLASLGAWPVSRYYNAPALRWLVMAAGIGILIRGVTPTRVHVLNRKVLLGRLTMMEIGSQVLSIIVMIAASWKLRTAWGLMIGVLVGDVARVLLSYLILPGHRHKFRLDPEAMKELVRVGRWVIVSTAGYYAVGNVDRLALGRLLSVRDVGIYSIAFQTVSVVTGLGRAVGARVLYPILAETARLSPDKLYHMLRRGRLYWILPTVVGLLILSVWGDVFVHLLYKPVYQSAGWMLRILAAGAIAGVVNNATGIAWNTLGEFKMSAIFNFIQLGFLMTAILVGHALFGSVGFVVGVASVEFLIFPVQAALIQRRHKLWQPEVDLPVLLACGVLVAIGTLAR